MVDLRIGIIDSGFAAHQAAQVQSARRFVLSPKGLTEEETQPDEFGHGSAVLDTLLSQSGTMSLSVAQVFNAQRRTSPLQIAAALYWLIGQEVRLINLSLGLRMDRPLLREACADAQAAGILLCASSPAQGTPVFPASYPGVLRITGDARCTAGQWSWLNSPQADFGTAVSAANGVSGASMACAALSGQIAGFLLQHPDAESAAVIDWLRAGASFIGPERRSR